MISPRYRREAAFHRAELIEVAMTPAGDLSALRHALALVEAPGPEGLTAALVDRAARELRDGRRSLTDTFTVLAQLRRGLTLAPELEVRLAQFDNGYLLARAGLAGDVAEVGADLEAWLTGFAGAEAAYFEGPIDHALGLPADQAGAFLAALSRYLASPATPFAADPAEVWSEPDGTTVTLYLNRAAWDAARAAFSPLPAATTSPAGHRPPGARQPGPPPPRPG